MKVISNYARNLPTPAEYMICVPTTREWRLLIKVYAEDVSENILSTTWNTFKIQSTKKIFLVSRYGCTKYLLSFYWTHSHPPTPSLSAKQIFFGCYRQLFTDFRKPKLVTKPFAVQTQKLPEGLLAARLDICKKPFPA